MSKSIQVKPEPFCPDCGAKMVLRRPTPGKSWKPFWGCNRFPDCRGKRAIDEETGLPESDVDMEQRESMKKDYASDYEPW